MNTTSHVPMAELQKESRMGAMGATSTTRDVRRIDLSNFETRKAEIADQLWHRTCPGQEGAIVGRMPGDIFFRHAVGAHGAPLVVIAAEPGMRQVAKARVAGHVSGRQMAVVVDDRHLRRVVVI